jgi:hypothetical protein
VIGATRYVAPDLFFHRTCDRTEPSP